MDEENQKMTRTLCRLATSHARDVYVLLREAGFPCDVALEIMQVFSIAFNDYVPSNYKPNRREAP